MNRQNCLPTNITTKMIEKIAIIDHYFHNLFIEDIDTDLLEEKYHGEEEEYIKDNYTFYGEWSWDYVNSISYYPLDDDPRDVTDLRDLI